MDLQFEFDRTIEMLREHKNKNEIILTPHLGEFSRLSGIPVKEIELDRFKCTADFAKKYSLENQRVLLRPLEESDFAHLLIFAENEPEIWQWNREGAIGAENLEIYIDSALEGRRKEEQSEQAYSEGQQRRTQPIDVRSCDDGSGELIATA